MKSFEYLAESSNSHTHQWRLLKLNYFSSHSCDSWISEKFKLTPTSSDHRLTQNAGTFFLIVIELVDWMDGKNKKRQRKNSIRFFHSSHLSLMFDHRATHFQLVALAVNESNEASTHRGKNSIQLFFLDFYSGSMIVTFFLISKFELSGVCCCCWWEWSANRHHIRWLSRRRWESREENFISSRMWPSRCFSCRRSRRIHYNMTTE